MASKQLVAIITTLTKNDDGSGSLKIPGIGQAVRVHNVNRFRDLQKAQETAGAAFLWQLSRETPEQAEDHTTGPEDPGNDPEWAPAPGDLVKRLGEAFGRSLDRQEEGSLMTYYIGAVDDDCRYTVMRRTGVVWQQVDFNSQPLQTRREACLKLLRQVRIRSDLEPARHRTLATWAHHLVTATDAWYGPLKHQAKAEQTLPLGAQGLTVEQLGRILERVAAFDAHPETPDMSTAKLADPYHQVDLGDGRWRIEHGYEYLNTPPDQQQRFVPDLLLLDARQLWELKFPLTEARLKPHPDTVRKLARQLQAIQQDRPGEGWTAHLCQVAWDSGTVLVTPVAP